MTILLLPISDWENRYARVCRQSSCLKIRSLDDKAIGSCRQIERTSRQGNKEMLACHQSVNTSPLPPPHTHTHTRRHDIFTVRPWDGENAVIK